MANMAPKCSYCGEQINTRGSKGWSRAFRNHPELPEDVWKPPADGYGVIHCCDTEFCNARSAHIPEAAFLTARLDAARFMGYIASNPMRGERGHEPT